METIPCEFEWGHWISPLSFKMPQVHGAVPVGAVVLRKERQVSEEFSGVKVTYFVATEDELEELAGKREVAEILLEQMLPYMRNTGTLPRHTTVKKAFKNGNVELQYQPSTYDTFNLRLTPEMLDGEKPADFVAALKPHDPTNDPVEPMAVERIRANTSEPWVVEAARSGRAKCRICRSQIAKGEVRIGVPPDDDAFGSSVRWYHLDCAAASIGDPHDLRGLYKLDPPLQQQVRDAIQAAHAD